MLNGFLPNPSFAFGFIDIDSYSVGSGISGQFSVGNGGGMISLSNGVSASLIGWVDITSDITTPECGGSPGTCEYDQSSRHAIRSCGAIPEQDSTPPPAS